MDHVAFTRAEVDGVGQAARSVRVLVTQASGLFLGDSIISIFARCGALLRVPQRAVGLKPRIRSSSVARCREGCLSLLEAAANNVARPVLLFFAAAAFNAARPVLLTRRFG